MSYITDKFPFCPLLSDGNLNRTCLKMTECRINIIAVFYSDEVPRNGLHFIFLGVKIMSIFISVSHVRK